MMDRRMTSMTSDQASQKLQLFISGRNLADLDFITVTDSFLIIKLQQPNKPQKVILKTKVYDNDLNPDYAETVTIQYFFQIRQKLKFEVYHQASPPKLVGQTQTSLGQIFGSPQNGLKRQLINHKGKKSGELLVRCEKVTKSTNNMLEFTLQCSELPTTFSFLCFGSNCNSFYRVFRKRNQDQLLIYESQPVYGTSNPRFIGCKISERRLCKNDPEFQFQIRVYKYVSSGNHEEFGRVLTNVSKILDPKPQPIMDRHGRSKGIANFRRVKQYVKNTFTDYISAGLQLMLITCIDFTASNGSPKSPTSLHYIQANKKSPYEQALQQVSRILLDYDYDKQVPVYGFGAKCSMPNFSSYGNVHHCFPLNGNEQNAHVFMVQGIMKAYRNAIQYLQFGGPTYFNVILDSAIQECYQIQKQINQYMIVFILTDGDIHDKNKVIDQIIQCCRLPISLIIVGIGNGPFDIMNEIDDDDCQLVDSKGRKTTRDLVQFVEFRKFRNNGIELAREVLQQLPRQVQEYYQIMNYGPDRLKQIQPPPQIFPPIHPQVQNPNLQANPYFNARY